MAKRIQGPMHDFSRHWGESDVQMARRIQDQLELEIDRQQNWQRLQDAVDNPTAEPDLELIAARAGRFMRLNWPALREHLAGDAAKLHGWQAETAQRVAAQQEAATTVHAPKLVGYSEGDQNFYDPNLTECGAGLLDGATIAQHRSQVTCLACRGVKGMALQRPKKRARRR